MIGVICRVTDRGFGFVSVKGEPKDVFFHAKSLQAPLLFDDKLVGKRVEFELTEGDKGPRAEFVREVL